MSVLRQSWWEVSTVCARRKSALLRVSNAQACVVVGFVWYFTDIKLNQKDT
jgi:hypothetical protein